MMGSWDWGFAVFGMVIAALIVGAVVLVAIVVLSVLVAIHFPRLHLGRPRNPCEWNCYDVREILTAKDGATSESTGRGRLVQQLDVRWWVGFSSRNRAKWFFGLLRTEPRA